MHFSSPDLSPCPPGYLPALHRCSGGISNRSRTEPIFLASPPKKAKPKLFSMPHFSKWHHDPPCCLSPKSRIVSFSTFPIQPLSTPVSLPPKLIQNPPTLLCFHFCHPVPKAPPPLPISLSRPSNWSTTSPLHPLQSILNMVARANLQNINQVIPPSN